MKIVYQVCFGKFQVNLPLTIDIASIDSAMFLTYMPPTRKLLKEAQKK